jgi:hypothetical protein
MRSVIQLLILQLPPLAALAVAGAVGAPCLWAGTAMASAGPPYGALDQAGLLLCVFGATGALWAWAFTEEKVSGWLSGRRDEDAVGSGRDAAGPDARGGRKAA